MLTCKWPHVCGHPLEHGQIINAWTAPPFPEKKKSEHTVNHLQQPSTAIRYLLLYVGLLGQQVDSVDYKAGHQPLRPQLYDWDTHEWKD